MSNSSRVLRIKVPWRRVCAALPAVALVGSGIAVSSPAAPGHNLKAVAVSSEAPAIVVPDTALTVPAAPAVVSPKNPSLAPAPVASKVAAVGGSALVTLDSAGIPVRALEGYRRAASLVNSADPACHIDWALLGAIGKVESNHARFGGNQLDSAGVAQPGIIGIPLDGSNQTARIADTDGGLLDRDTVFDRAVGPMQFIPGTWRVVGVDADGDGASNPQDMVDAASAAAVYLCSGPGDLSLPGDLSAAVMRYNASDAYVRMVTAIADAYRHGVTALPASDLPVANSVTSTTVAGQPGPIATTMSAQTPTATLGATTSASPASALAVSVPSTSVATAPLETLPVTTTPVTSTPTVGPTPTATVSSSTPTLMPTPDPTAVPDPTATSDPTATPLPDPTATASTSTSPPTA